LLFSSLNFYKIFFNLLPPLMSILLLNLVAMPIFLFACIVLFVCYFVGCLDCCRIILWIVFYCYVVWYRIVFFAINFLCYFIFNNGKARRFLYKHQLKQIQIVVSPFYIPSSKKQGHKFLFYTNGNNSFLSTMKFCRFRPDYSYQLAQYYWNFAEFVNNS